MELTFRLYPLRFQFLAHEPVHFPAGAPANILRGAFGHMFRRVAGEAEYVRFFAPVRSRERGPSGLHDLPRPFVFRAGHLDDAVVGAGGHFSFDMHIFAVADPPIKALLESFSRLAVDGLGESRSRVDLTAVTQLDAVGRPVATVGVSPLELSLMPPTGPVSRIHIRFATATEMKGGGRSLVDRPEFSALAARVRDRLSTLRQLYDEGPLDVDFLQFGENAKGVWMTRCEVRRVEASRRSSRTGESHRLGGFVGEVEYEGELTAYLPYLEAAQWTGVGRQTSWGKGQMVVTDISRH